MSQFLGQWNPGDFKEIDHFVVAYKPTQFQQPFAWIQELLLPSPDPEKIVPGSVYLFQRDFERAFPSHAKTASDHGLTGWKDLLG